ncbi:hypothetical protein [Nocardia sp. NPDC019255]|uniref:hypothetical protein n=1 Tax=Nocardia sp. NPDC019255 TaxID=3154591 RepID=UPI0033CE5C11
MTTLADTEMWRHNHRHCHHDGTFRSLDEARFVSNVHSGHGPACLQYLAAHAYSSLGSEDGLDYAD